MLVGIIAILNSTFDSSLPSGAIDFIAEEFHVTDPVQHALPISVYLVGYILGPLLFSPMSETYGRRIVMVPTFALFTIFTLACALAKDWVSFLFFRLICGINASSSIAITSGIYADIYADPVVRGRVIAFYISVSPIRRRMLYDPFSLVFVGYIIWATAGAHRIWRRFDSQLAMDLLGRIHHPGPVLCPSLLSSRDFQANHPTQPRREAAEEEPRPQNLRTH